VKGDRLSKKINNRFEHPLIVVSDCMYATFTNATPLMRVSLMQSFVWWIRRRAAVVYLASITYDCRFGMTLVRSFRGPAIIATIIRDPPTIVVIITRTYISKARCGKGEVPSIGLHTKIRAMSV